MQFARHAHDDRKQYALKFFLDRRAFNTEQAHYQTPGMHGILPPIDDIVSNDDHHLQALGMCEPC